MADTGHDITIGVESAVPGTFTEIGAVQSITFPGVTRGTTDVTTLKSKAREFVGTIPEAGDLDIAILWDEASIEQEKLQASVELTTTRHGVNYQVSFPGGTKWVFKAIPTEAVPSQASVDEAKLLNFKAKLTGGRGTVTVA